MRHFPTGVLADRYARLALGNSHYQIIQSIVVHYGAVQWYDGRTDRQTDTVDREDENRAASTN